MKNWELIKEMAKVALGDETTVHRGRWVAVLQWANDQEIFGAPVTEDDIKWAQEVEYPHKVVIPQEIKDNIEEIVREQEEAADDPELRERAEKLHKELSRIKPEYFTRVIG